MGVAVAVYRHRASIAGIPIRDRHDVRLVRGAWLSVCPAVAWATQKPNSAPVTRQAATGCPCGGSRTAAAGGAKMLVGEARVGAGGRWKTSRAREAGFIDLTRSPTSLRSVSLHPSRRLSDRRAKRSTYPKKASLTSSNQAPEPSDTAYGFNSTSIFAVLCTLTSISG